MGTHSKHTPDQILNLLRQIEIGVADGETHPMAFPEIGVTEQTDYRWSKEYAA
jgi:putative transposase